MSDLNSLVKELQDKINKQTLLINKLKGEVAENADAPKKLQEKEKEIASLKSNVEELNAKIEEFKKLQDADILMQQIKEKDTQLNQFQTQLNEKDKIIEEQKQKIAEIEAQIPACQALIQDLQQQLASKMQAAPSTPSYTQSYTQPYNTGKAPDVDEGFYPKPSMLGPKPTSGTYGAPGEMERQCPSCGVMGFAIKEVEDKTKVLSYSPIVYGKKRVCTKCGYEF